MLTKIFNWFKILYNTTNYIETSDNKICIDECEQSIESSSIIYLPPIDNISVELNTENKYLLVKYNEIDNFIHKNIEHTVTYNIKCDINNNISAHYISGFLVVIIDAENLIK